jgi:hypothetical protein
MEIGVSGTERVERIVAPGGVAVAALQDPGAISLDRRDVLGLSRQPKPQRFGFPAEWARASSRSAQLSTTPLEALGDCDFAIVCADTHMAADGSCDTSNVRGRGAPTSRRTRSHQVDRVGGDDRQAHWGDRQTDLLPARVPE